MSKEKYRRIHLIYSILLSVLLAVAGICLIIACVGIYRSGSKPFSPESVAAAFSGIAVPVYLCIVLVIGGFVLDGFLPGTKAKTAPQKQYDAILARLCRKADMRYAPPHLQQQIRTMHKRRKLFKGISLGLLGICTVIFLSYGLNAKHFHPSEINTSMVKAMYWFVPCLAIPFCFGVFTVYYERASIRKEIEFVKQILASGAQNSESPAEAPAKRNPLMILRWGLLVAGIAILVYGFLAGGTKDVLTKAINICTECVGLG